LEAFQTLARCFGRDNVDVKKVLIDGDVSFIIFQRHSHVTQTLILSGYSFLNFVVSFLILHTFLEMTCQTKKYYCYQDNERLNDHQHCNRGKMRRV